MTASFVNWHLEKYRRSDIQTWPMDIIVKFLYKQYTKKKQKKTMQQKLFRSPQYSQSVYETFLKIGCFQRGSPKKTLKS